MPVTCTEVLVRFHQPPAIYSATTPAPNYFRFRISPDVVIAMGMQVLYSGEMMTGRSTELMVTQCTRAASMDAYERLLFDAMKGDATLFAREDSVEQAWRIVEPVLGTATAPIEYEPNTWGPDAATRLTADFGDWHNPAVTVKERT
jgi:glucose-6-phosphate 1-dehydrogenase